MSASLQDRTVLVIGRGSGIARATTRAAREAGARVVAAGRHPELLAQAYDDPHITTAYVDVNDESSIVALADVLGSVDHVVNTASARARGLVGDLAADVVTQSLRTKVVGPILLAQHLGPRMPEDGSFVLLSGQASLRPTPGMLAVGATNAAVDVLVKGLAVELAPIRVNAVSPGTIDTGAYDALGDAAKAELFERLTRESPVRRIGTPEDVAEAVMFALTSTFTTGTVLAVNGGEPL